MGYPDVAARGSVSSKSVPSLGERWMLKQIFNAIGPVPLRLVVKDGAEMTPPGVTPVATIVIPDRRTLSRLLFDSEMVFGEGYAEGRIKVEGDLVAALEAVYEALPQNSDARWHLRFMSKAMYWLQDNTKRGSKQNIHTHYDLGNDFYRLWLDSQLVYTCAYFPSPDATLEAAQAAKMDYVCRKLRLQPGETVAEAGCGWGSLALHMAQHYGVSVKSFNISREQIAHARREASNRGLNGRVEFIEDDYRNIIGNFDAFVSVGMLEHVGLRHYPEFGRVIHRAIGDRGRGLIHFIGRSYKADFSRWIRRRIFPGAYTPALSEALEILQTYRYGVWDVENLRPHYAKTLEHWLERFDRAGEKVLEMYSPWFQRAWRLYLAGSIAGFRTGALQLFQICFSGSEAPLGSWTRAPLYADAKF